MAEKLRLGIAGLGTVGSSLVSLIESEASAFVSVTGKEVIITAVSARDRSKDRGVALDAYHWFDDPVALVQSPDIDVFVELIGSDEGPARVAVEAALSSGKHVVTANKALLAKHGTALATLAEANGVALNYEAAVAGGIPVIKTFRESLTGNTLSRVFGIMNGTCNYILTRMEREKISFEDCLADAQRLGYAEADPIFDIGGHDTAHKLAILTSVAFGTEVSFESIYLEGIENISLADIEAADRLGYRIKLLGVAQKTDSGIEQRVHPAMVRKEAAIAQIDGVTNAVAIDADPIGSLMLSGPGAGGGATASAVAGDIADLARGTQTPVFGKRAADLLPYRQADIQLHEGGYYLHVMLEDKPGAFARIATVMAGHDISLKSVIQDRATRRPNQAGNGAQPVVIITHETTEHAIRDAFREITERGDVVGEPKLIRIETLT